MDTISGNSETIGAKTSKTRNLGEKGREHVTRDVGGGGVRSACVVRVTEGGGGIASCYFDIF